MTNDERVKKIRVGWITDYPNPEFTGDKIQCLVSIAAAQEDISFLFTLIDADREKIGGYLNALKLWIGVLTTAIDQIVVTRGERAQDQVSLGEIEEMLRGQRREMFTALGEG